MRSHPFVYASIVLAILGYFANGEYQAIKARLDATQRKLDSMIDSTSSTSDSLRKAIDRIGNLFRDQAIELESLKSANENLSDRIANATCPAPIRKQVDEPKLIKITPRIIMHSGADCGACNQWKQHLQPAWENVGWQVEVITELHSARSWPWFEVHDADGRTFEVDGQLTKDSYERARIEVAK